MESEGKWCIEKDCIGTVCVNVTEDLIYFVYRTSKSEYTQYKDDLLYNPLQIFSNKRINIRANTVRRAMEWSRRTRELVAEWLWQDRQQWNYSNSDEDIYMKKVEDDEIKEG